MTLIRLQRLFTDELSKRSILSRPPEPPPDALMNDPLKSVFIGITGVFNVPFYWSSLNITNPHMAIVGITGAGKSYFVKSFLIRASYVWNTNAVIIDWAGEYKAWVKQTGGTVVSLGKGDFINIMDVAGMRPLDRVKQIMNSFSILTDIDMFPEQKRLTEEAIEQAYLNNGFALADIAPEGKDAPTIKDVILLLQEKLQEGTYQYPAELENAIYRLRQFARPGEDYFSRKSTINIGKLALSGLVDIDLSGMSDERFRALAALFILQTLKELMRSMGWSEVKGLKTLVVLDEAWKVAGDERSDAITIVREGRKYQFGLIVASQSPLDVNEAIFSNVGTVFILAIKFERFLNYLQGSLNFSSYIRSEILKFGVGQAAVVMSFQTSLKFPGTFIIKRIYGEEPLKVYRIDITSILTQSEIESNIIPRTFEFEKDSINSFLVEIGLANEVIDKIFSDADTKNRVIDIMSLVSELASNQIPSISIVNLLKNIGIDDSIIARILSRVKTNE
ncbi:MAG: DNA double-strand break repair helicase HerA [Candidatus Micrarchaeota archaeon]|nr:MAG: DNA double-strand break repair helicase HerA [Candidatus Micrarchaeota archaeon]